MRVGRHLARRQGGTVTPAASTGHKRGEDGGGKRKRKRKRKPQAQRARSEPSRSSEGSPGLAKCVSPTISARSRRKRPFLLRGRDRSRAGIRRRSYVEGVQHGGDHVCEADDASPRAARVSLCEGSNLLHCAQAAPTDGDKDMNRAPMSARWLLTLFAATSTLCACAGGGPAAYVPDAAEGQDESDPGAGGSSGASGNGGGRARPGKAKPGEASGGESSGSSSGSSSSGISSGVTSSGSSSTGSSSGGQPDSGGTAV